MRRPPAPAPTLPKYVSYLRVSTQRQGQSGLGLEAQRETVAAHVRAANGQLVGEHIDTLSGRRRRRPNLREALACAKREGATLIVAKLDRLARDAAFLLELVDGGVSVHFCDLPEVNASGAAGRMMLTIMAAFAEFESRRIGERQREAQAARRARGGSAKKPCATRKAKRSYRQYAEKRKADGVRFNERLKKRIDRFLTKGYTWAAIADLLNRQGHRTLAGKKWTLANLWRAVRAAEPDAASQAAPQAK